MVKIEFRSILTKNSIATSTVYSSQTSDKPVGPTANHLRTTCGGHVIWLIGLIASLSLSLLFFSVRFCLYRRKILFYSDVLLLRR